jgi:hypothetical protein
MTWISPSLNTDGSPLTDVVGYRISYGTSAGNLTGSTDVAGAAVTSSTISDLVAGTYYFSVVTLNSAGVASAPTSPVSRSFP